MPTSPMPTEPVPPEPVPPEPVPGDPTRTDPAETSLDEALLARWEASLPGQEAMGRRLIGRYREPQRRYHSVRHLEQVLRWIDEFAGAQDLFLVRLAAWFHDAVYAIPLRELTNEEASARLSVRELSRAGLEQEDLTQVARLVRLTATHVPSGRDPEGELLCDADLAILAAAPEDYARYVAEVREEYAYVPERDFLAARLDVLTDLSAGPIFRTAKARALAPAARANLEREIAELERRLDEAP